MKRILSLMLMSALLLTLFSGISVSAEDTYVSAYEDFNENVSIVSNDPDAMSVTVEGSPLTYELSGTFVSGSTADNTVAYDWVKSAAGYNNSNGLYICGSVNNGGTYTGVLNGKLKMGFDPVTEGKIFVSYWYKFSKNSRTADLGTLYDGDTPIVVIRNGGSRNEEDGNYCYNGAFTYANQVKFVAADTAWHKISYLADLDANTYTLYVDDTLVDTYDFSATPAKVDSIAFGTYGYHSGFTQNYYIDDVIVCEAPDVNTRTVNFYKDGELYESRQVGFGQKTEFPVLSDIDGKYFSGWYGDENGETTVDLTMVTENINVYAVYKPYVIREDFGKTTSFRIDKENKTVKTDSGFTFTANEYQYEVMSSGNGVFTSAGRQLTENGIQNSLEIGFDAITEGKAELSFKYAMTAHNQNGNATGFGYLEGCSERLHAAYSKVGFGTTTDVAQKTEAPYTLASDTGWHKVTYKLDIDNSSYYIVFDGTSYGPYTINNTSVDKLKFDAGNHSSQKYSYDLKDICLILDPDNNIKSHTVIYMDEGKELGRETVLTGEEAAQTPDLSGGDKVFSGWYLDESGTKQANIECVTGDMTVYAKYLPETVHTPNREVPKIGDVTTVTVEESLSDGKLAAATFGGKKLVYAVSGDTLYVYDMTDLSNTSKLGAYEYTLSGGQGLFVCGNYLISSANNAVKVIALDESGLPTGIKETVNLNGSVTKLEILDNLLFVTAGAKVEVYDVSDLSAGIKKFITPVADSAIHSSATKISDIRYRIYIFASKEYTKTDATIDYTTKLMIYDVINTPEGYISNKLFDGIPDYSAVNAWPCYGIYGEDETVSGWVEFSPCNYGYINYTGPDTIRLTCGISASGAVRNDDFLIDVSNPKAPKVISMREKGVYECAPLHLKLDDVCAVEFPRYANPQGETLAYFYDYSDKDYIRTNAEIKGLSGKAAAASDGRGYIMGDSCINVIDLYDASGNFSASNVYLTDKTGAMGTEVRSGIISGKSYLYNPGAEREVVMVAALYGLAENDLKDIRTYPYTLKTGFNEIENEVDLNSLAYFDTYTTYLRMYLWDGMNTAKPLSKSAKSNAVTVNDVEFDIWISDETETVQGIVIMDRHGIGETLREQTAFRNFCAENDWAIISFVDGAGQELTGFEDLDRAGNLIINQIDAFAVSTGHSELSNAPIATFGHSSATLFAERFAYWAKDRCFAAVAFRAHSANVFKYDLLEVPFMVNQGETDAYANNNGQLALSQSLGAKGGLVNYVLDPECSHGMNDWNTLSIIMPFLEEAYAARVPEGVDFNTIKPTLKTIDKTTGWLGDISNCYDYIMDCKPNGDDHEWGEVVEEVKEYSIKPYSEGDSANDSWLFNEDYANKWYEFSMTGVVSGIEYK